MVTSKGCQRESADWFVGNPQVAQRCSDCSGIGGSVGFVHMLVLFPVCAVSPSFSRDVQHGSILNGYSQHSATHRIVSAADKTSQRIFCLCLNARLTEHLVSVRTVRSVTGRGQPLRASQLSNFESVSLARGRSTWCKCMSDNAARCGWWSHGVSEYNQNRKHSN